MMRAGRACSIASLAAVPLAALGASAYEDPPPNYITADVTWRDEGKGKDRTERGQLWFKDLPRRKEDGGTGGFGALGYYNGIKWFVPRNPGDVWMARIEDVEDPASFLLHDHFGEETVVFAFDRVDVVRSRESLTKQLLAEAEKPPAPPPSKAAGEGDDLADDLIGGIVGREKERTIDEALADDAEREKRGAKAQGATAASPLRFATEKDVGAAAIPLSALRKIVFLEAGDGVKREEYKGRFVAFSRQARGDGGRVRVEAATYFGGPDAGERFSFAGFIGDEAVLLAGNYLDLGFVDRRLVEVLGKDPPPDAYPTAEHVDGRGRKRVEEPRRTATFAFFSPDLARLVRVARLPWGVATFGSLILSSDGKGPAYFAGAAGPHFDAFARETRLAGVVENPEAVAEARTRKREPGSDWCVVKFLPGFTGVEWCARFKHAGLSAFIRPDGKLLVQRGHDLFHIGPDGAVEKGPALEVARGNVAVDPRTGAVYFGGSYRSGTGLEPYVNPYLYKLDARGALAWTAYGWSGPIVGVEQHRLVSDSSVTRVRVGDDGSLTLTGWSDGGNTVLSYQPHDMRREAPTSGFASSTWGATGGITVRIAHIIHMDAETMEVDHCTKYVAYRPTSDVPTLLNIYDIYGMENGEVAITGGAWTGFIETHDAWVKSWYMESQENPFAEAKGGPMFTLFKPDFSLPRMSTITPGASGLKLAGRGARLILYGGGYAVRPPADPRNTRRRLQPVVKNAFQPEIGGGLDGYAILVDTQGGKYPPPGAKERKPEGPRRSAAQVPEKPPELDDAARMTLTTFGKGVFDMTKNPRPYVVFLILDQEGNRCPSFLCGRNLSGKVAFNPEEDILERCVRIRTEGSFTLEVGHAAHKHGMDGVLPGGEWVARLREQPITIAFDRIADGVFAGSEVTKMTTGRGLTGSGASVHFDVTCGGAISVGGQKARFQGKGRLTFLGGAPAFTLRATFPLPGKELGLGGPKGEGITATLYTGSAVTTVMPTITPAGDAGGADLLTD